MTRIINIAIIGFGMAGRVFHAPIINSMGEFRLAKVYTRNDETACLVNSLYKDTEVVSDYSDILNDKEVELVVIASPNGMHFELAKEALKNGKHVIVEKPFTIISKEAEELIELAKAQELILTVYQNRRWDSDFKTVKKVIESGSLGNLVEYEAHFDRFRSRPKQNSWREENIPGSGMLYDLGSHLIDQAQYLFGLPKEIYADIRMQRECGKTHDNFELIMYYEKLKVTLKVGMLVKESLPKYILLGDKGSFVKYGIDVQEEALKNGKTPLSITDWGREPDSIWGTINSEIDGINIRGKVESEVGDYREFYRNVYNAIVNKEELIVKSEQGKNTTKIIELAMESSKRRAVVKFE